MTDKHYVSCPNIQADNCWPRDYHIKQSMSERKTNAVWFHVNVESKNKANEQTWQNRNRVTDTEDKEVIARGIGDGGLER